MYISHRIIVCHSRPYFARSPWFQSASDQRLGTRPKWSGRASRDKSCWKRPKAYRSRAVETEWVGHFPWINPL